jgi:hypothetical protein
MVAAQQRSMTITARSTAAILFVLLAATPAFAGGKTSQASTRSVQGAKRVRAVERVVEDGPGLGRSRIAVKGTMHQVQTDIPVTGHLTFEPSKTSPIVKVTLRDDRGYYQPMKLVLPLSAGSYFKGYGSVSPSRFFSFTTPATLGNPGWGRNAKGTVKVSRDAIELGYEIASYGPNMDFSLKLTPQ